MPCPNPNCHSYDSLKPNPDISGIGVLIAFAVSAYLTLILCIASYLNDQNGASNPVDRLIIDALPALWQRRGPQRTAKLGEALQKALLSFSDLQIITGFSILVSGYSQLKCGLSVYHWVTVVNLAWFSTLTHLTTLTSLRKYFQTRPAFRLWRLIGMGVTIVMLGAALGSTGFLTNSNSLKANFPAWCLYHPRLADISIHSYNIVYITVAMCILGASFLTRVVQLFQRASDKLRDALRTGPSNALKGFLTRLKDCSDRSSSRGSSSSVIGSLSAKGTRIFWLVMHILFISIYCLLKAAADLYGSMLWEVTWVVVALAWGTIRVLVNRNIDFSYDGIDFSYDGTEYAFSYKEENDWGFGQVLIVSMLIIPILSLSELYYEIALARANGDPAIGDPSIDADSNNQPSIPLSIDQSPGQIYDFLYQYRWFRKLLLLMYGISLTKAAMALYAFPYAQLTQDLNSKFDFVVSYVGTILACDIIVVWLFTISCISFQYPDPVLRSYRTGRFLKRFFDRPNSGGYGEWFWNGLIILIIGNLILLNYYLLFREI